MVAADTTPVRFRLKVLSTIQLANDNIVRKAQVIMEKADDTAWTIMESKNGTLSSTAKKEKGSKCLNCEVNCSELSQIGIATISLSYGMPVGVLIKEAWCHPIEGS